MQRNIYEPSDVRSAVCQKPISWKRPLAAPLGGGEIHVKSRIVEAQRLTAPLLGSIKMLGNTCGTNDFRGTVSHNQPRGSDLWQHPWGEPRCLEIRMESMTFEAQRRRQHRGNDLWQHPRGEPKMLGNTYKIYDFRGVASLASLCKGSLTAPLGKPRCLETRIKPVTFEAYRLTISTGDVTSGIPYETNDFRRAASCNHRGSDLWQHP